MYHKKLPHASLAPFLAAVQENPADPHAWLQLGLVLARFHQNDKAADCFAQVLVLAPDLIATHPAFVDLARRASPHPPVWLVDITR